MKLRSLLSLEGIGLESNRSSALTEYGCEQVSGSVSFAIITWWTDLEAQEDVEVELRRELERLEVVGGNVGREGRPYITIQPTSSNNIHR